MLIEYVCQMVILTATALRPFIVEIYSLHIATPLSRLYIYALQKYDTYFIFIYYTMFDGIVALI